MHGYRNIYIDDLHLEGVNSSAEWSPCDLLYVANFGKTAFTRIVIYIMNNCVD